MERVLIDTFIVPAASKAEFLNEVRKSSRFLRTLPGFVEGYIYEKIDGTGEFNVVTSAVWQSDEAFTNARNLALEGFRKIGFNPQEIMSRLNVSIQRSIYTREPY